MTYLAGMPVKWTDDNGEIQSGDIVNFFQHPEGIFALVVKKDGKFQALHISEIKLKLSGED